MHIPPPLYPSARPPLRPQVRALFEKNIKPNLPPSEELGPGHDANKFRRHHAYIECVTRCLERNGDELRCIFKCALS